MVIDLNKKLSEHPDIFNSNWTKRWLRIIAFTGTIGLVAYYFVVYKKYRDIKPIQKK